MSRMPFILAIATLFLGASVIVTHAVTSEPQPGAGAPATSASPPSSATEQHDQTGPTGSEGATEGHKKQASQEKKAIKHTQKAITLGKAGNTDGLRMHAETALKIAERAEQRHPETHVEEGIKHLKMAIEEAQKGNAGEGTKHAEEALTQLKMK